MMKSRLGIAIALIVLAAVLLSASFVLNDNPASNAVVAQVASPTLTLTSTPLTSVTETPTPAELLLATLPSEQVSPLGVAVTETPWVCPYWRGVTQRGILDSVHMGETINYLVHLPPCYEQLPSYRFPVLYLLHGWPLNEYHWVQLGVTELVDDWLSRGLSGPFILVLPGVTQNEGRYVHSSGGAGSFEGMLVEELLPRIEAEYRVWQAPEARAIGGISRGGIWALEIGMRNPDLFMSVAGHSPALSVNNPPRIYDPFFLAQDLAPGQRLYLDAGDADWTRGSTQQLRDVLIEHGAQVTYEIHNGAHVDELWSGALPSYLAFYTALWPVELAGLPHVEADPEQHWLGQP